MTTTTVKKELVGMYRVDDPTCHKVTVGKYTILRQDDSSVWIQIEGEEGQQVGDEIFEAFLTKFFWERF